MTLAKLAIDGGDKSIVDKLPSFLTPEGRTFGPEEEALLLEALRSGCLSSNGGRMVKGVEKDFAKALGVKYAVACSSGTACVHLAVAGLDLEPGEEVIVPPITDIGTILPVLWQNAIPVFADVDPQTMLIDPKSVEANITPRTRAVIAVHLAGAVCALDELWAICRRHRLILIEDCSQAYWASYKGKLVGSIGNMACFSMQQSKHMTCGEGGLMVTSTDAFAERARLFSDKAWPRDQGKLGAFRFLFLAQNYRMSELNGAVAWAQLGKVASVVQRRRSAAESLTAQIADLAGVTPPHVAKDTEHAYWLYMLGIHRASGTTALEFGEALLAEGVPAWVRYIVDPLYLSPVIAQHRTYGTSGYPLSTHGSQKYVRGLCPNAEAALNGTIAIHWNENYGKDHVDQIASAIRKVAAHFQKKGS
jgi:dTDP-4-amino-4,6-dideoxygalactose transaminase